MSLSVFDQFGNVDQTAIASNEAAIEALGEPARKALFDLIAADQAERDGEARLAAARKDAREKSDAYDNALNVSNAFNPPQTHQEALLDVIAVGRGEKPAPRRADPIMAARTVIDDLVKRWLDGDKAQKQKIEADLLKARATLENIIAAKKMADELGKKLANADDKATPKIKAQLDQARGVLDALVVKPAEAKEILHRAIEAVTLARAELQKATIEAKRLEVAKGNAVLTWMNSQTDKPTALDIARAAAKADSDRRHAANLAAPAPKGPKKWPLETVMEARGSVRRTPRQYLGPR